MTIATDADLLAAAVRVGDVHDEPAWLRGLRARAAELHAATPLPSRAVHLWRFTPPETFEIDVSPLGRAAPPAPGGDPDWPAPVAAAWSRGALDGAAWLRGPGVARADLGPDAARAGVVLAGLREAAARHTGLVQPYLAALAGPEEGRFEALNTAAWEGGLFLFVPGGVRLAAPVHLLREALPGSAAAVTRLLLVVEEGAAVTVVDEAFSGADGPAVVSAAVELVARAGADVRVVSVQRYGAGVTAFESRRAAVAADARLLHVQASLGAGCFKMVHGVALAGRGAEARFTGVAVADAARVLDHHTAHEHEAPDTRSDLHLRVVLRDRARSIYTGLIRVDGGAVNADAYQENRNLLLDPSARVESIPELEILTDAVRCTHGATMGPVDPEQVHYLMARGLPREDAVRLIVAGFVEPALARMPEDVRGRLREVLDGRLGLGVGDRTLGAEEGGGEEMV